MSTEKGRIAESESVGRSGFPGDVGGEDRLGAARAEESGGHVGRKEEEGERGETVSGRVGKEGLLSWCEGSGQSGGGCVGAGTTGVGSGGIGEGSAHRGRVGERAVGDRVVGDGSRCKGRDSRDLSSPQSLGDRSDVVLHLDEQVERVEGHSGVVVNVERSLLYGERLGLLREGGVGALERDWNGGGVCDRSVDASSGGRDDSYDDVLETESTRARRRWCSVLRAHGGHEGGEDVEDVVRSEDDGVACRKLSRAVSSECGDGGSDEGVGTSGAGAHRREGIEDGGGGLRVGFGGVGGGSEEGESREEGTGAGGKLRVGVECGKESSAGGGYGRGNEGIRRRCGGT